jgi:hypothetical protein
MVGRRPVIAVPRYRYMADQAAGGRQRKMHLLRALRNLLPAAMYDHQERLF